MKELIKNILILAKAIYSDAALKNNSKIIMNMLPIQKEGLSLLIAYDWPGREYDDDRDLYGYQLIAEPKDWDSKKCIRLMYNIKKDLFFLQRVYKSSGISRRFEDENMLKKIYEVLKSIKEQDLT